MGLLDHNRTWRFTVRATPDECRRAFVDVVTAKPGLKLRAARWSVRNSALQAPDGRSLSAIVATYEGRAGLAAGATMIAGGRAQNAEKVAIGSELTFAVEGTRDGQTTCVMFMSKAGTAFGFTGDAGYFRGCMNNVQRALTLLDQTVNVEKV